jgi:hypothetical protein
VSESFDLELKLDSPSFLAGVGFPEVAILSSRSSISISDRDRFTGLGDLDSSITNLDLVEGCHGCDFVRGIVVAAHSLGKLVV